MLNLNTAIMNDERTLALAKRILEETENKRINWVRSTNAYSYRVSLGSGMIVLESNPDSNIFPKYKLSIFNDNNIELDSLEIMNSTNENYSLLKKIYELAENNYLKKDETYESMFDALNLPF